jgi:electron transport complex protein RnfG
MAEEKVIHKTQAPGEHKTKEYSIFQIASNLAMVCIACGMLIAIVYYFTAPITEKKNAQMKQESMQALVNDADKFVAVDGKAEWYEAQKDGKTIAYVVPSDTKGYGGTIEMLVAVSKDSTVLDFQILSANETPGLGSNASKDSFRNQFEGKKSDALSVVKDKTNKENIQAMTGATITSTAVTKGVKEAVDEVSAYMGGK